MSVSHEKSDSRDINRWHSSFTVTFTPDSTTAVIKMDRKLGTRVEVLRIVGNWVSTLCLRQGAPNAVIVLLTLLPLHATKESSAVLSCYVTVTSEEPWCETQVDTDDMYRHRTLHTRDAQEEEYLLKMESPYMQHIQEMVVSGVFSVTVGVITEDCKVKTLK